MINTNPDTAIFNIQNTDQLTFNVIPLLHEVKHALNNLIENNDTTVIDLRSIPLASGEEDNILNILGQGEVHAQLNTLGPSQIIESQYSGVWIITHYNPDKEIISRFIEITTMPDILFSQKQDIPDSLEALTTTVSENLPVKPSSTEKQS